MEACGKLAIFKKQWKLIKEPPGTLGHMDSNARSLKIQVLTPSPRPTFLFTPMAKGLRCLILLASLLVVDGLATGKLGKELKKEKGGT